MAQAMAGGQQLKVSYLHASLPLEKDYRDGKIRCARIGILPRRECRLQIWNEGQNGRKVQKGNTTKLKNGRIGSKSLIINAVGKVLHVKR